MLGFQNHVAFLSVRDKQNLYYFIDLPRQLIHWFFPFYKNNKEPCISNRKKMIGIKSQLWIKIINEKIMHYLLFSVACFSCFPSRIFHSMFLKHNKIHENDIRNSLTRDETTGEIREFVFCVHLASSSKVYGFLFTFSWHTSISQADVSELPPLTNFEGQDVWNFYWIYDTEKQK